MPLPAGPFRQITMKNKGTAPFYMLTFDEDGLCTAPKTEAALAADASAGGYSHIFVFSHGWNNDFETALGRYLAFIEKFQGVIPQGSPLLQPGFKPLLVGVNWPSIDLLFPWEEPPTIQSANPLDTDPGIDPIARNDEAEVQLVARLLPPEKRERFYALAGSQKGMTDVEADALADMLLPLYATGSDPTEPTEMPGSKDALIEFWRKTVSAAKNEAKAVPGQPKPAALLGFLPDPRDAIRVFTVWKMKDRAGKVGATGVRSLLNKLLKASPGAKCHLIGHSFGCKVLLSAVGAGDPQPRQVTSMLLLQPAVNCYCFAPDADGHGLVGGYRPVLSRIQQPILSTFSSHDMPLTQFFHLALWRASDLGETKITRAGDPPSRYAALGGFGPQGSAAGEARTIDILPPGKAYVLGDPAGMRVIGLCSDAAIDGHGGVVNPATAWALYCQVAV